MIGKREARREALKTQDRSEPVGEVGANKRLIGEGTPVEGDDELGDGTLDYLPQRRGKDVKEANV